MFKIQQYNLTAFYFISKGTSQEAFELNKIMYAPYHTPAETLFTPEISTHTYVLNGPAGPVTRLSHYISLRKGPWVLCNSSSNLG